MKDVPLLAWVCVGAILLMVVGMYLSLFTAWRRRNQKPPTDEGNGEKLLNTLRQPWAREDADWDELHRRAEELKKKSPPGP